MSEEILINASAQQTRVALLQQGVVQELHIERALSRGRVGNIYLGKVIRVLPGMQSAFVDIGLERAAFLHIADIWQPPSSGQNDSHSATPSTAFQPIETMLHEGQVLMVQVMKDPLGTKSTRLSTHISIAGHTLVYLPQEPHIGISQKIENAATREILRTRLAAELSPEETGGYIIRTHAEDADPATLRRDIVYLRKTWAAIQFQAVRVPPATLLYQDLNLAQRVLRDFVSEATERIQIDEDETFQTLSRFAAEFVPGVSGRLYHYTGQQSLFDFYRVESEILSALSRRVDLKSGGYLVIDQTEAMTTIDVNTGGYVGSRSFADTIFKTNLEATQSIARQLRLRNLGGIIIIDFIDMQSDEHRQSVLNELQKALANDRARIALHGFSPLGLVEMTRKRTRESLAHTLCKTCPACAGTGQIRQI